MAKIIVDPVTRIEGHLKLEVEVEGNVVVDAWTSGTLWRGMELIMQGRDPRDAEQIMQRICGVCPTSHKDGRRGSRKNISHCPGQLFILRNA
jgi:hydrogenase large subunit